ncbi:MAG: epoxyqueuosine reductase [Peptococcaceae bacterium]|nr:epoxyqueuosine reductase [Peptococcaceae bacterium]
MKERIYNTITRVIEESGLPYYREPLLGVTGVNNPYVRRLKEVVHPGHLLPEDILTGARSVVAYYLPFRKHIPEGNRGGRNASRLWAEVYIETNRLLARIAEEIAAELSRDGHSCAWEKPTHNFDPGLLVSFWSHKHVAFACGIGRFGRNHLLITERGCAGRIGSVVTGWEPETPSGEDERDPFYNCPEKCHYCYKSCPAGALTESGLDKGACYRMCLENDSLYADLELCDVCGKCATGPCSVLNEL